jgi:PAS domain S-box-containing protein
VKANSPIVETSTILIVEDDPGIAELERSRLEEAGYLAIVAPTAEEALRWVGRGGIDLVLLDYRLPDGQDGLEFYSRVKAAGLDLPVILVTGYGNEATVIQALRGGVRDFVTKSLEYLDYLPEAVERVLRQVGTERRLAESEARLAGIIESVKDAIIVVEADDLVSLFNPAAERMFGCRSADAIGRPLSDFIPNEFVHPEEVGDADLGTLTLRLRMGTRGRRAGGEEFPLEASVASGKVGEDKFHTVVVRDVTARRAAEETLLLRDRAIRAVTQGILISDVGQPDHPTIYASPGFERLTGYTAAEAIGRNCRFLQGKDTDPVAVAHLRDAVRAGQSCSVELLNYRKDGSSFWNELSISPVFDADRRLTHFVGIQTDVTARWNLEQQFRQIQKMEAVGQLAAGVAHDFNNLLTIINGYTEMLMDMLPKADAGQALLNEIYKAGERSAGLTRQLLAFSRQQVLALRVLDLNEVVTDTEKMLRRLIGEDVRLSTNLDPNLWAVRTDPGQIEQVLMNLAVNARDAMPRGGRLTIQTQNVDLDETFVQSHPEARLGPQVLLSVSDTGTGMPPEVKARIFEPFFTTKGPGKGTGLGLATVYGIVKQSGGHVGVYSEVGIGTTFKVYLPRAASRSAATGQSQAATPPRGDETILLVEDDAVVRALVRRILEGSGYLVLEADSGEEAVLTATTHPGRIHLLVTDVVMPEMGGRGVAEVVAGVHPGIKILYLSGYTDDAIVRHGVLHEGVNFLQKPFSSFALTHKVREILDGK